MFAFGASSDRIRGSEATNRDRRIVWAGLLRVNPRDGELGTPTLMAGGVAYAIFIAGLGWLGAF